MNAAVLPQQTANDQAAVVLQALLARGQVKESDVARASAAATTSRLPVLAVLLRTGVLSERDYAHASAEAMGLPVLTTDQVAHPPASSLQEEIGVSLRFLRQFHVCPLAVDDTHVTLWVADACDGYAAAAIALASGRAVCQQVGVRAEIDDALERWFGQGRTAMDTIVDGASGDRAEIDDVDQLRDMASEAPVIRLVNLIIQGAADLRASDIHIEPFESRLKVRYRVDGVLVDGESPPSALAAAVISRIKIMARMNIAERRLPQDGRIMMRVQGRELDLRVSSMPTAHGESVVMRLLDRQTVALELTNLGFEAGFLAQFNKVLEQPHGIVLVTGPTGSGKTTTLYAALSRLNQPEVKIITIEDPVEYQIEGINQIQARPQIGLDFANALRSIVRQDPDVIMIGEMRDLETARIAIQSALTGHLVLSTLHTNNAAGGITRLLDMGVEDYLLTSTVNGILAQRLVRRLEPVHAQRYTASEAEIARFSLRRYQPEGDIHLYRAVPSELSATGYHGRTTIMELLVMTDALRSAVIRRAGMAEMESIARAAGMRTMYEDGIAKALRGLTTLEEVLRVTEDAP